PVLPGTPGPGSGPGPAVLLRRLLLCLVRGDLSVVVRLPGRVCDPAVPEARPCGAGPAGAYAPSPLTVAVRREVQHRRRHRDGARPGPGGSQGVRARTVRRLHFRRGRLPASG